MEHVQYGDRLRSPDRFLGFRPQQLTWGIKGSFRRYFEGLSDHAYELSGGARQNDTGLFTFQTAQNDEEPSSGRHAYSFSGEMVMTAHHGALSILIANPEILLDSTGAASLSAVVDRDAETLVRLTIADLTLEHVSGDTILQANFSAKLAYDGQYLFMGNYYAGEQLDPVSIHFDEVRGESG